MGLNATLRGLKLAGMVVCAAAIAGCESGDVSDLTSFANDRMAVDDVSDVDYYKSDGLLTTAKLQFKDKNYGKAYALYKRSVELFPKDPVAWLGFAASSDMIARFDTSDRAYRVLSGMIGNRPEYHNNVGYSYLLRGNLKSARRYFLKAYELDPTNETTANNLQLLKNSVNFAKR